MIYYTEQIHLRMLRFSASHMNGPGLESSGCITPFSRENSKSSFRKFYDGNHDLANRYGISVSQMSQQLCCLSKTKSNTTDATSAAGTAYLSSSHPGFSRVHVAQSLVLCVMFCISFVLLPLATILHVLQFTASEYTIGIFNLFLN